MTLSEWGSERCPHTGQDAPAAEQVKRPLGVNAGWAFIGSLVYSACQWGILVVLTKFGSAAMVGQYVLALAICAPVLAFASLALSAVLTTDARGDFRFAEYLRLRLLTTAGALVVVAAIALAPRHGSERAFAILLVALWQGIDWVSEVFYGLFQRAERLDLVGVSRMARGVLSLLLLAIAVSVSGSLLWGLCGLCAASVLVLGGYDVRRGAALQVALPGPAPAAPTGAGWGLHRLGKLARLSMPLGFAAAFSALNSNMPRYFLKHYYGERELGIFASVAAFMVIGQMAADAIAVSASARLARYYAMRDGLSFRALLARLVAVGLLLGLIGWMLAVALGRPLLAFVYRPEYTEYTGILAGLMGVSAIPFVAVFLSYGLTAARGFRMQSALQTVLVGVSALLCALLIPVYGMSGAILAIGGSRLIQVVLLILCHCRVMRALNPGGKLA